MEFNEIPRIKESSKMLDAYYELEAQLMEINRIIPFDNSPKTYSIRLYQILQSACAQIENLMRIICDYANLEYKTPKKPNGDFPTFFKLLNKDNVLSLQVVAVRQSDNEAIIPFAILKTKKTPFWWQEYNETKHTLPEGFKSGTLENTKYAMAALYALHCTIFYWNNHYGDSVLEKTNWKHKSSVSIDMYSQIHRDKEDYRPRSNSFYCISHTLINE